MDLKLKRYLEKTENSAVLKDPWQLRILSDFLVELAREEDKPPDYDNPSWAYEQADRNGAKRAYLRLARMVKGRNRDERRKDRGT